MQPKITESAPATLAFAIRTTSASRDGLRTLPAEGDVQILSMTNRQCRDIVHFLTQGRKSARQNSSQLALFWCDPVISATPRLLLSCAFSVACRGMGLAIQKSRSSDNCAAQELEAPINPVRLIRAHLPTPRLFDGRDSATKAGCAGLGWPYLGS